MKRLLMASFLGLAALGFNAVAHGPSKAEHGGVVQAAGDLSFELVSQGDRAALYVIDHDKPADVSKMTGKLTVLDGAEKTEAELKPATGNKLEAAARLPAGAKAVATVTAPNGKTVTVRFAMK
jgi:hypothetical protein